MSSYAEATNTRQFKQSRNTQYNCCIKPNIHVHKRFWSTIAIQFRIKLLSYTRSWYDLTLRNTVIFLFLSCLTHEVYYQFFFIEQIVLNNSAEYKSFVIVLVLLLFINYIFQTSQKITVNFPADETPKYVFYLINRLFPFIQSAHIKYITKLLSDFFLPHTY